MNSRRELLVRLFGLLEQSGISYCVMRNYSDLFDSDTSDVDLLVVPADVVQTIDCCRRAAGHSGHKLVQQTRFVNHSLVLWDGTGGFVRIDIDTEKRWRLFHFFRAAEILRERRKHGDFYIPHPKHECIILLTQMLWRGRLGERYARQLRLLESQMPAAEGFCGVFKQAFGLDGSPLGDIDDPGLSARLKKGIFLNVFRRPGNVPHMLNYAFKDCCRFLTRLKSPPGATLRVATARGFDAGALAGKLAVLFPLQKGLINPVSGLAVVKALFKGGLVIEARDAGNNEGLAACEPWLGTAPRSARAFAAMVAADGEMHAAHLETGAMSGSRIALDRFICETLARQLASGRARGTGAFVVILGLDGSGKTTFARHVCALAAESARFSGTRYFHWLPPLFGPLRFPFPTYREVPRKQAAPPSFAGAAISVLRLFRNLGRSILSCATRIPSLVRRGRLVLVDRFYYNYWIDPVSLRYSGPAWLLKVVRQIFPMQDAVVVLQADAATLLSRKRELSPGEIEHQAALLREFPVRAVRRIELDASQPPEVLARQLLDQL